MKSYQTSRRIFSFLEFVGWVAVAIGFITAISLANSVGPYARGGAAFAALLPGLAISLIGLIFIGGVQGWRASVDTAEFTQQMLKLSRDQLAISRQALMSNRSGTASFGQRPTPTGQENSPTFAGETKGSERPRRSEERSVQSKENTAGESIAVQNKGPAAADTRFVTDENGFRMLNEQGSQLEYRGRRFSLEGGVYYLEGQKFGNSYLLKRHLNQLKDLSE